MGWEVPRKSHGGKQCLGLKCLKSRAQQNEGGQQKQHRQAYTWQE